MPYLYVMYMYILFVSTTQPTSWYTFMRPTPNNDMISTGIHVFMRESHLVPLHHTEVVTTFRGISCKSTDSADGIDNKNVIFGYLS